MRKAVLISCLLLFSIIGFAQSNQIVAETINNNDTTIEFINKGRINLINKLLEGDVTKVKEIKNSLLLVDNEKYMVFYPYEIRLLLYLTGENDELLYYINSFDEQAIEKLMLKIAPAEDVLQENLIKAVRKNRINIENKIRTDLLEKEDRDFLVMNLHYLLEAKDYPDVTVETLNADADVFLNKYPDSKYVPYTRHYIRYKLVTSDWGWGFEIFSGYGICTKNLCEKFGGSVPVGVAFDVAYKKWTLNLRDYIGIGRTYEDINTNGIVWPKNTKANVILPEASLGYILPSKSRIHFAPFAGVGGLNFTPTSNQRNEKYYDGGSICSFACTMGLNMDIQLGKANKTVPIILYSQKGNWFLRIRYAYVISQFGNKYAGFEGNMHYLTIGFGAITHKVKHKL